MSWFGGSLTSLTDQLTNIARDVLLDPAPPIHPPSASAAAATPPPADSRLLNTAVLSDEKSLAERVLSGDDVSTTVLQQAGVEGALSDQPVEDAWASSGLPRLQSLDDGCDVDEQPAERDHTRLVAATGQLNESQSQQLQQAGVDALRAQLQLVCTERDQLKESVEQLDAENQAATDQLELVRAEAAGWHQTATEAQAQVQLARSERQRQALDNERLTCRLEDVEENVAALRTTRTRLAEQLAAAEGGKSAPPCADACVLTAELVQQSQAVQTTMTSSPDLAAGLVLEDDEAFRQRQISTLKHQLSGSSLCVEDQTADGCRQRRSPDAGACVGVRQPDAADTSAVLLAGMRDALASVYGHDHVRCASSGQLVELVESLARRASDNVAPDNDADDHVACSDSDGGAGGGRLYRTRSCDDLPSEYEDDTVPAEWCAGGGGGEDIAADNFDANDGDADLECAAAGGGGGAVLSVGAGRMSQMTLPPISEDGERLLELQDEVVRLQQAVDAGHTLDARLQCALSACDRLQARVAAAEDAVQLCHRQQLHERSQQQQQQQQLEERLTSSCREVAVLQRRVDTAERQLCEERTRGTQLLSDKQLIDERLTEAQCQLTECRQQLQQLTAEAYERSEKPCTGDSALLTVEKPSKTSAAAVSPAVSQNSQCCDDNTDGGRDDATTGGVQMALSVRSDPDGDSLAASCRVDRQQQLQQLQETIAARDAEIAELVGRTATHADASRRIAELLDAEREVWLRERHQLASALSQKHAESVGYHNELQRQLAQMSAAEQTRQQLAADMLAAKQQCERGEAERQRLQLELERLRRHLVDIEENYTQETLRADQSIAELRQQLAATHAVSAESEAANRRADNVQEQLAAAIQQRDDVTLQLDDVTDSLANLQRVLEQFQRDKRREIDTATSATQRRCEQLEQQAASLQEQLLESSRGLAAADRLEEQLNRKEDTIAALRTEVEAKQSVVQKLRIELDEIRCNTAGKVDKSLVKNLMVGWFSAPHSQRAHVLRVIATVLDLNADERRRVGIDEAATSPAASAGLAQAFVRFLESESTRSSVSSSAATDSTQQQQPAGRPASSVSLDAQQMAVEAARKLSSRVPRQPPVCVPSASVSSGVTGGVTGGVPVGGYPLVLATPGHSRQSSSSSSHNLLLSTLSPDCLPSTNATATSSTTLSAIIDGAGEEGATSAEDGAHLV